MEEGRERSFVMVKPDGMRRGLKDEIIRRLEATEVDGVKLKIIASKEMMATPEIVAKHYPLDPAYLLTMGHVDPSGWTEEQKQAQIEKMHGRVIEMHQLIQSGPVFPMIIEGPVGTVAKIREIVGKTNPVEAAPGTIRGDFGDDSYAAADAEGRSVRTIVHASGNIEEAEAEIKNWFPEFEG
jgi:nucleoside-diphosphate kinase